MNEILWITVLIFMFLVAIGFLKHDPILHLISVIIGILLTIETFGESPYLGFAMAIASLYIAYVALVVEWDKG